MSNLALIGCAHIHTPGFVKRLQARSDVKVTKIWDHNRERAMKWVNELGASFIADPGEAWGDGSITAAIVCAETNLHEGLVLDGAAAKKHLFVEKPLGMGAADAYKMARAIEQAGVHFQTGYFMRGNPVHQFLRQQIQSGSFGKLSRVRHANCHSGSIGRWFDTDWRWMTDLAQAGIGAFGDLGTHSLDILLWLLGLEVSSVTAAVDVTLANYGDCDEFGEGMLRFKASPVIGSLAAGWVDVANPLTCEISGSEGHAYVRNGELFFKSSHVAGADGKEPWSGLPPAWSHAFELFLDAVIGKPHPPLVSAQEAAVRSAVMEAMYQATKSNEWVAPQTA